MTRFRDIFRSALKLLLGRGVRHSYSQDAEDLLVDGLLRKATGTYVDIGAYHPTLYSNTYALYKKGWSGLVVDPNESMRALYAFFRPRDRFVARGVAGEPSSRTYYRFNDGAYNTFMPEVAERLRSARYPKYLGTSEVRLLPLRTLLTEEGITSIDFLSIDVEGMDAEVLLSHDWSLPPKVIAVEDTTFSSDAPGASRAYRYLRDKGYRLAAHTPNTLIFEREALLEPKAAPVV